MAALCAVPAVPAAQHCFTCQLLSKLLSEVQRLGCSCSMPAVRFVIHHSMSKSIENYCERQGPRYLLFEVEREENEGGSACFSGCVWL